MVGEIRYFAGNFAPRGWAFCDGQLLPIFQNDALFSLLGTTYGGDGRTTFALPDMRGRVALHNGTGAGLSSRTQGIRGGSENKQLNAMNLPTHSHPMQVASDNASSNVPANKSLASAEIYTTYDNTNAVNSEPTSSAGGGQLFTNIQPSATAHCIIALTGVYPSRY
ncbi:tail fiber protein [Alteromonas sp. ASW11-19]|uniref:Tail fiber protein n=1 Tax=Alteromonas salexigens TaxID=2982530 RepID=A0ABT2VRF1_9ALTE|nr:tail fiber protein [Alteromonas salexigens]MCU7555876.1 tail fiber protein [Alteromonas salexigens]